MKHARWEEDAMNRIFMLPEVRDRSSLRCVWIETGNARQPLACMWIDRKPRTTAAGT
jgi:hypothetical protein